MNDVILEVNNLKKYFPVRKGFWRKKIGEVKAVDDVSFSITEGKTMGLVGESGCGKSTLGRTIIRLLEPTAGKVNFAGKDFLSFQGQDLRIQRKEIQMIFQDPYASLDPRMTVAQILEQPFRIHGSLRHPEMKDRLQTLIKMVGLSPLHLSRYPHEFSGGQRQRISIARAIALQPKLIIADEPVSALDVSIQAQILNLMKDLQERLQLTFLFISHDLSVIEHMSDTVAVMYLGKIVEIAPRQLLFSDPQHPYTQSLMKAIPKIGVGKKKTLTKESALLSTEVPTALSPPSGCSFHTRCPFKMDICERQTPVLTTNGTSVDHKSACWLSNKGSQHG